MKGKIMLNTRYTVMISLISLSLMAGKSDGVEAAGKDPMNQYNVVWTTPSTGPAGSMPVGNGDIGLNVWVEEDGDLLFYIAKTDAWTSTFGKGDDLIKLGRVRVRLEPNPFQKGLPFSQQLQLRQGRILILTGDKKNESEISVWVDANHPVIHVESKSTQPLKMNVSYETWRKEGDKILETPDDRESPRIMTLWVWRQVGRG